MGELDGKVAIVTGAGRGIGRAIARGLTEKGAAVAITARSVEQLQCVAEEIESANGRVIVIPADLTHDEDINRLFAQVREQFGSLSILVNNAGAFDGGPIDELSVEKWDHVLAVNLRAPFLCTQAAMAWMKQQGQGGRIINIGSISAQRVRPQSAAYSASKHGLWGLTQVTALEGRVHGITCGCLHPGNVEVERRHTDKDEDSEPMMQPDEIARVAVLMACLPPHVEMLEAIVLPHEQQYVGRG